MSRGLCDKPSVNIIRKYDCGPMLAIECEFLSCSLPFSVSFRYAEGLVCLAPSVILIVERNFIELPPLVSSNPTRGSKAQVWKWFERIPLHSWFFSSVIERNWLVKNRNSVSKWALKFVGIVYGDSELFPRVCPARVSGYNVVIFCSIGTPHSDCTGKSKFTQEARKLSTRLDIDTKAPKLLCLSKQILCWSSTILRCFQRFRRNEKFQHSNLYLYNL